MTKVTYKYTTVQAVQGVTTNQNALVNNSMREKSVALLLYARETLYDHLYTLLNFNSYPVIIISACYAFETYLSGAL